MKRINWLQLIILPIAIAIMVVAWVEPWAQWIVLSTGINRVGEVPSPGVMLLVILASMVVTRQAVRQVRYQRRKIVLGGLLVIVLVTALTYQPFDPAAFLYNLLDWRDFVAPELVTAMAVAALWWRGILIGRSRALIDENLERTFFNGVLALACLLVVNQSSHRIAPFDLQAAILIFFATALSTLTVVNIELSRARPTEGGSWFSRQRHWLATIFGVVGSILLGGLLITNLFSPDTVREFLSSLGPAFSSVANRLVDVLRPILTFFFWLISPLVPVLQAILRVLLQGILVFFRIIHDLGVQLNQARVEQQIQSFLDSPEFAVFSRGTTVALLLILFVLLAIWALARSGLLSRRNQDETRESIASRELLIGQLKHLLNRLRRKQESITGRYLSLSGDDACQAVRRVYQDFLEMARLRGQSRAPHQTPNQYAQHLAAQSESQRDSLNTLTDLYMHARYDAAPLTSTEAQAAQEALVQLRAAPVIQSPLSEE